jgi:ArsR family transcriptional regulator
MKEVIDMKQLSPELLSNAASFFKVLGDETRMKILYTISSDEFCVNDIANAVGMTKSAVSHQLKFLKNQGLVKSRRMGKNIFYSLDDHHVVEIVNTAFIHIEHKAHNEDCHCGKCDDFNH